jgi:transcriptional regulator GlxA family with amidase domain
MNFGILIFPGVEELDFVGPWEMARVWSVLAGGPENCFIIAESLDPVVCAKGLSVNPSMTVGDCPQLDLLLVPGGQGTRKEVENPALIGFIAEQARDCRAVLSVCTGSFLLHRAGLLSGKKATTHWASLDRLRELGDVNVVEERFVQDGKIWSSAGVSAGIDLMLAVIANVAGDEAAGKVQFRAEYYPSPTRYGNDHESDEAPEYLRIGTKVAI